MFKEPGVGHLLLAAALWGTNPAALRVVYLSQQPATPAFVAAVQSLVATVFLASLARLLPRRASDAPNRPRDLRGLLLVGLVVGTCAFVANAFTVVGFAHTVAVRGAFLIRLSVVFTLLLAVVSGQAVRRSLWGGAAFALVGAVLVAVDAGGTGLFPVRGGDAAIIVAAFLWAVQTQQIGRYASSFRPLELAALIQAVMAVWSLAWLCIDGGTGIARGVSLATQWGLGRDPLEWAILVWPALGPWGIATALQVHAQRRISGSHTQIILGATDPIWAIIFAMGLGAREEHLGPLGLVGAAALFTALVVSSWVTSPRRAPPAPALATVPGR